MKMSILMMCLQLLFNGGMAYTVVNDDGFYVIDEEREGVFHTILCKVDSVESVGYEKIGSNDSVCVNVYDKDDIIVIDNEKGWKKFQLLEVELNEHGEPLRMIEAKKGKVLVIDEMNK